MSVDLLKGISAYNTMAGMSVDKTLDVGLTPEVAKQQKGTFSSLVQKILSNSINTLRKNEAVSTAAITQNVPLNEIVTSINEAELTLQTVIAVRDRVIASYQDIIKMPI